MKVSRNFSNFKILILYKDEEFRNYVQAIDRPMLIGMHATLFLLTYYFIGLKV